MLEHQTAQILQLPQTRILKLISSLILCIRNPLKEVQESGFRAIASLALYIRTHSAPSFVQELLENLLTETMASLFIGGVDTDSVSSACSAVHGLATILPVTSSYCHLNDRINIKACYRVFSRGVKARNMNDLDVLLRSLQFQQERNSRVLEWKWIRKEI
jgi:hypothetical protein